jgi:glutathione synthase/RimK-type ligase-like ATP-grasp enzyme/Tfp pilus assembly protein PilF
MPSNQPIEDEAPVSPAQARAALSEALAAEREGRWDDSRRLCRRALRDASLQPEGFNLFGRLCLQGGDSATAIAMQRMALALAPGDRQTAEDLFVALGAVRSTADAERSFASAVAPAPDVTAHHRLPASLVPFVGMDLVEHGLQRALESDPSFAPAHAALGNIRARRQRLLAATDAYRLAAMLQWDWPDVHLALAHLFDALHDDASAARHRFEALSRKQLYAAATAGTSRRVLVTAAPGPTAANTPLDFCINHTVVALHVWYLAEGAPMPALPPYDLVFNAIEEAEASAAAIERCLRFVDAQSKPVINHPKHLAKVRRSMLPATLQAVPGCTTPPTFRLQRADLAAAGGSAKPAGLDVPILIRPLDSHGGRGLEQIAAPAQIPDYLERVAGEHFYASPFVDYRSADSYYRKYRVIVVDGVPFPYHLAISEGWMVHYHSSLMEQHAWMRAEEERFLREPRSVFAAWDTVFRDIATAVGLDYFGVDCAVTGDGSVLVFECGGGMLVQCMDPPELFAYKYDYVPRIFAALDELFVARLDARAAG